MNQANDERLVFISYSHNDTELVLPVAERLRNAGLRVWLDKWELRVGGKFVREIESAMSDAFAVVLFVSKASIRSGWVREEYDAAKVYSVKSDLQIIPVILDNVKVPAFLAGTHAAFLSNGMLSVCVDILDAVAGGKTVYNFERTLRSYQDVPFEVKDRKLVERKNRAVSLATYIAKERRRGAYLSMKAGDDAGDTDGSVLKWGWNTTRDYAQWLVMRYAVRVLEEAPPSKFKSVSLSIATEKASLPVDYRLYLPEPWCEDSGRCKAAGVPEDISFSTKPEIALAQIEAAYERGVLSGIVLADAGYGNNTAFREGVEALGLQYIVGVNPSTSIWAPGVKPLPPKPRASSARGRAPSRHRYAKGHEPQSCEQIALEVDEQEWEFVEWREGTNETLSGWFIALRVRAAHRDHLTNVLRDEQWLLVEWPEDEEAPTKYSLSTLPATASLQDLVYSHKMRWRIERDYQELKDELGLNHYEGRNWRGFHHHASLCVATYAFLVAERLTHPVGRKKNVIPRKEPTLPKDYIPRGSPEGTTSRR